MLILERSISRNGQHRDAAAAVVGYDQELASRVDGLTNTVVSCRDARPTRGTLQEVSARPLVFPHCSSAAERAGGWLGPTWARAKDGMIHQAASGPSRASLFHPRIDRASYSLPNS